MKYPTVSSLCEGIAESIRRKEGSTEKINPQDFVQRIDNLQVGGGTSESNIEYLDVSGLEDVKDIAMLSQFMRTKSKIGNPMIGVMPSAYPFAIGMTSNVDILAVAIDLSAETFSQGQFDKMPLADFLAMMGIDLDSIPRITKEQFYSLE